MRIRRHILLASILAILLISAALAAVRYDQVIITGGPKGRPGLVTSAPLSVIENFTTVTANRTLAPQQGDHSGKVYRVAGTAAVTITLPTPTARLSGYTYTFLNDANQTLTISCSGKISGDDGNNNYQNRNSVSLAQPNRMRGHMLRVVCTGSYWAVQVLTPNAALTWAGGS